MRIDTATSSIAVAIGDLYQQAEVVAPSAERPIVPLAELLESRNIFHTQLPGLSSRAAVDFLLQKGGVLELPHEVDHEPLAGYFYASGCVASIFIEQTDMVVRRRFSAAHELGHYILHFLPLYAAGETQSMSDSFFQTVEDTEPDEIPEGHIKLTPPGKMQSITLSPSKMEREANQFAVELLMPAPVVAELVARQQPLLKGEDLVRRVATDLLVSRAAMRWRLHALGILLP